MVTVGDAVLAAIDTNWSGAGGTKPTIISEEDETLARFKSTDWILARTFSRGEDIREHNDKYVNREILIVLRINAYDATNKEARLEEIITEIERIINTDGVTGFNRVKVRRIDYAPTDKRVKNVCRADLTVRLEIFIQDGATTPGSQAHSTITVDELTVNTWIDVSGASVKGPITMADSDATLIDLNPSGATGTAGIIDITPTNTLGSGEAWRGLKILGSALDPTAATATIEGVKVDLTGVLMTNNPNMTGLNVQLPLTYGTGTEQVAYFAGDNRLVRVCTDSYAIEADSDVKFDADITDGTDAFTIAELADLLMFGSANAAWVNCPWEGGSGDSLFRISSVGAIHNTAASSLGWLSFSVPLPCNKGGLKLYISGTEIGLLDADAEAYVDTTYLYGYAAEVKTTLDTDATDKDAPGAHQDTFTAVDCSGYDAVKVVLGIESDVVNEIDIYYVTVRAYYAT